MASDLIGGFKFSDQFPVLLLGRSYQSGKN